MIKIIIVTGSQMRTREDMRRPDAIKPSPPSPPPQPPPSPEQQQRKCAVKTLKTHEVAWRPMRPLPAIWTYELSSHQSKSQLTKLMKQNATYLLLNRRGFGFLAKFCSHAAADLVFLSELPKATSHPLARWSCTHTHTQLPRDVSGAATLTPQGLCVEGAVRQA